MSSTAASGPQRSGRPETGRVTVGNLELDLSTYRVTIASLVRELTYQEFELLRHLAALRDQVVSFDALSAFLWGATGRRELRRLNVLVCRLRGKLSGCEPYRLETVRGRGYGFLNHASRGAPAQGRKGGAS